MIPLLARAAGLTGIYLLVLTSMAPGDVLVGALLGLAVAVALRPRGAHRTREAPLARIGAAGSVLLRTGSEMVQGSWRVVRFCLGLPGAPGFVEIPREDRSDVSVALWGVLTGEAPDEIVVDVDVERDVLIVHLVDARDPDAVRARHRRAYERWQRTVVR
jgi:multisubunit Na+/H+ antiporter MnhE subunit